MVAILLAPSASAWAQPEGSEPDPATDFIPDPFDDELPVEEAGDELIPEEPEPVGDDQGEPDDEPEPEPEPEPADQYEEVEAKPKPKPKRPARTAPTTDPTGATQVTLTAPKLDQDWYQLGKESDLAARLDAHARMMQAHDGARADMELTRMNELRQSLGIRNIPLASSLLVKEAQAELDAGRHDRAVVLADAASVLSPDLPSVHWLRLKSSFAFKKTDVVKFVGIVFDAVLGRFSAFRNQVALLTDLAVVGWLSILLITLIFALIQGLKYLRYVGHDLVAVGPSWFSELQSVAFVLLVWAAPLVFGLGLAPTLALILATVLAYQSRGEKLIGVAALLWVTLIPAWLWLSAPLLMFHGSVADDLEIVTTEAFAIDAEKRLAAYARGQGKEDFDIAVALATRARIRGDISEAIKWYKRGLQIRPRSVAAENNLGRLKYLIRDTSAIKHFERAAKNTSRAEPLLNVASLHLDNSRFDEARNSINAARKIDGALTRKYNDLDTETSTAKKLLEVPFDKAELWGRVFDVDGEKCLVVAADLWRRMGSRLPIWAMPVLGLALLILGVLLALRRVSMRLTRPCPKCGRPAGPLAPEGYCEQCQSIFLNTLAVEPRTRLLKEHRIRAYQTRQRWIERVLSVFAGAGEFKAGNSIIGVALMLAFVFPAWIFLWSESMSIDTWTLAVAPTGFKLVALGVVPLVAGLISVVRAFGR